MDVIVRGKNVEITDALKDYVTKKMNKMAKFIDHQDVTAHVVLSVEKGRKIVEVTIPLEGFLLRAEESNSDMYASIDLVVDKLERQYRKYKTRERRKLIQEANLQKASEPLDLPNVVRRKTFPVKPMTLDEALLQMDLLGHDFFAFTNAETDSINVLYRRHDGDYGLLEPL
ncbi:ribosome hibernation-promoting factor, HPF/YfiA family [Sulfobacillus thermosulfidooxidans]|uniref:Ribosome hibernation promoting factor n=1 Tax=Sulfobacillus thermosulfidooxidans (strain DSM 9293 / VKM B-1269 / AT-1) TaxID=929705 RepID=A0A1W1WG07_SULTA|nr:ribosome-associated translation inhibitor RaiA [Sulfobacillus thermosulfidooxidans]OLZ10652.1 ribosomal subunit interface protein [Sulfobacillus thermosulfidooxidans]OLZ17543.1 ribosomal subunit interface protein [Sulfobacillus thermosulfidooxidans]OLZ20893.1 ribosomal subunit interface protein [Sulfobacillus thermosulfidooxidans]SMC05217.1 putative sigma-54 modulation protein [Sulfobacillus thermosulfidooxidans DSM 9293]